MGLCLKIWIYREEQILIPTNSILDPIFDPELKPASEKEVLDSTIERFFSEQPPEKRDESVSSGPDLEPEGRRPLLQLRRR